MVSPKFLNFVFIKKLDTLVAKDQFISYIKKIQVLEVLRYPDVAGRFTGLSAGLTHFLPAGVNLL